LFFEITARLDFHCRSRLVDILKEAKLLPYGQNPSAIDHSVENGSIEQRCAALLVLAALRAQNSSHKDRLCGVDQANPVLKDYAPLFRRSANGRAFLAPFLDDADKEARASGSIAKRRRSICGRRAGQTSTQ
jgi:hypothetical protein